jgi:hypothetical protein
VMAMAEADGRCPKFGSFGSAKPAGRGEGDPSCPPDLNRSGEQTVDEAELARLLERVAEPLMTEALADALHAEVCTLKGLARLLRPAGVAQ